MQSMTIRSVEPIVVALPCEVPYLGPLGPGESVNERGYFACKGPVPSQFILLRSTAAGNLSAAVV